MKITVLILSICVFHTLASSDIRKEAVLRVLPNRSQFFHYETVSLSCGQQEEWRVKRNTSKNINKDCFTSRNGTNESLCFIDDLYPSDSGVYWCESAEGECRDAVNITVTRGSVILESPVLPVMEGDDVTLRCTNRTPSASNLTDFYKDGFLIRSSSTGNMTIHNVSQSDEGLYKCNISGVGESLESWLTVRVSDSAVSDAPVMSVSRLICHIVVGTPFLVSTIILGLIYRDRRAPRLVADNRRHNVIMEVE
ncbi:low affinity immunoglobulin gamma Fc region receptor II-b-like isoform X3 [Dicentrarchus labrax]|uniref:low affinity immunoglobulin gamma Fc region receptor II-b-like isoform X3 n=1 Tax=Dicentrarchus labrax TaxID=13489 RepID=UPI0021F548A8|nr:low affinity immunoglobulin gamma Fc region receptor II-b-like isoform X3 [Dicentrarchus labrax]